MEQTTRDAYFKCNQCNLHSYYVARENVLTNLWSIAMAMMFTFARSQDAQRKQSIAEVLPVKHDSHVVCYYRQLMVNLSLVDISDIAAGS